MKIIIVLLSLFSCLIGKAQQKWVEVSGGKSVFNEIDSIYTFYKYHANGQLLSISFYEKDGNTQLGQQTTYNPNGTLAYIISYEKGRLFGPFVEFFSNGRIKTTGNFYNNFKQGQWFEYNENGKVISCIEYSLSGSDSISKMLLDDKRYNQLKIEFALMPMKLKDDIIETLPASHIYGILVPEKKRVLKYW